MLVPLQRIGLREAVLVAEHHRRLAESHLRARFLGQELDRDRTGVGEIDGDLVPVAGRRILPVDTEHPQGRLEKAERHHLPAGPQVLPRPQEERDARPAPVIDLGPHRDHGLRLGVRRHTRLAAVPLVLAAHHVPHVDRLQGVVDLRLLGPQGLGVEGGRRLHGDEAEHLEQVRDDHVAVGAGLVVEVGPALDGQRLRHVDLDVADVLPVPARLEQPVGEPQGQDVVDRLLAHEVVDAEDLRLVEDLVQLLVQVACRGQVGTERLLDDDAGARREIHSADHRDHGLERRRRDRQVEQAAGRAADLLLRLLDRAGQRAGLVRIRAAERKVRGEGVPGLALRLAGAELFRRLPRVLPELLGTQGELRGGRADDPVLLRHQPGRGEVEESRQQLALSQVTGGPEQHDDVVVRPGLGTCGCLRRRHLLSPPSSPGDRRIRSAWRTVPCR